MRCATTSPTRRWDTRFLGDLYQDLSEAARKTYALLQTPEFVEEFILDRTLTPAIEEFGLDGLRMIDPTCGSGHFLLGCVRPAGDGVAGAVAVAGRLRARPPRAGLGARGGHSTRSRWRSPASGCWSPR